MAEMKLNVTVGPDAANSNNRRLFVNGSQWAKVYGWDKASVEARCDTLVAALTPREEAPAEGAGEDDWLNGTREVPVGTPEWCARAEREILSLRARTSEPEAGEAAAWRGDGQYEPTAAMIEAGLETCRPGNHANMVTSFKAMMQQAELDGLITHPSPATADKLREVLTPFAQMADKFGCWSVVEVCAPDPDNPSPVIQPIRLSAFENAAALLATLSPKEEGGV